MVLMGIGLFWMALYLYIPIMSPYVVHQGGSLQLVGLVVAAYGIPQLILRIPLGSWSDRLGYRKPFLVAGFLAIVFSSMGMWLWPIPWAFVGWRILAGTAASFWAIFSILYVSYFPREQTLKSLGFVSFSNSTGQVLASLLGGGLAQIVGWSSPFWASAAIAVVGLVLILRIREPRKFHVQPTAQSVKTSTFTLLRQDSQLRAASLLGVFSQVTTFVTTFGYVPILAVHMGMSRAGLGLLLMVSLVPTAIFTVLTGSVLSRHWSVIQLVASGFTLVMVMTAITPFVPNILWLFITQALLGMGRGMLSPTLMTLAISGANHRYRATAMSTYQATYCIGMIGGPALAAWTVGQFGLIGAFGLASLASLIGAILAWMRSGTIGVWPVSKSQPASKV